MPYTYLLKHKSSGKYYYGVRFAKDCKPEDLFVEYFTSSKTVKDIIEDEGIDSFEVSIRKVFQSADDAKDWEAKFLTKVDARNNPDFFNKTNSRPIGAFYGMANGFSGKKHNENSRKKMSESAKNRKLHPRQGIRHTEESKKLISLNNAKRKSIVTPYGVFVSAEAFEKETGLISAVGLRNLLKIQDEKISKRRAEKNPLLTEESIGKTPKELGWFYE